MAVAGQRQGRLSFGTFEVDRESGELFKRGSPLHLQEKPLQLLLLLLEHPGQIVLREDLQRRLWPNGTYVDFDKGLNTAVKKLRYALGDSPDKPVFIETIPSPRIPLYRSDLGQRLSTRGAASRRNDSPDCNGQGRIQ